MYITLSAREKNPKILIYARGDSDAGLRRLKLARADQVVAAYQWAGMSIAAVERENPRLRIVALKRNDKRLEMIPAADTQIEPDDLLVVIGESDSLKRLASL
ncbi:TrkA C-terminal domain-containing protein [Candidatus Binatus sp.]|uniref:TrkA C-terminal domain-containing protein n=1 Tax=Candidatus Binatus sp. TaxID=2811406 RepID=UPI003C44184B